MDPNTLNLDPDPGFWPNLDPGLYVQAILKEKIQNNFREKFNFADPYHFDTDPDPESEKIRYGSGSGSRVNFDTDPDPDPDPGKNDTDPDPAKKDQVPGKSSKSV